MRLLFEENPKLAEQSELGEMAAYVATTRPPPLETVDHID